MTGFMLMGPAERWRFGVSGLSAGFKITPERGRKTIQNTDLAEKSRKPGSAEILLPQHIGMMGDVASDYVREGIDRDRAVAGDSGPCPGARGQVFEE